MARDSPEDYVVLRRADTAVEGEPSIAGRSVGFGDAFRFLRRRRKLIVWTVVIGTALALLTTNLVPPRYRAVAVLVFERSDTRLLQVAADYANEQLDFGAIETEMDVLRTRLFVGKVVDALDLAADPEFRFKTLLDYLAYAGKAIVPASIWPFRDTSSGSPRSEGSDGSKRAARNAEQGARAEPTKAERDLAILLFQSYMAIWRSGNSIAVSISVTNEDPERAAQFANAVGEVYIDWSLEIKRHAADGFFEFFRTRADRLVRRIADLEREMTSFSAENNLASSRQDDTLRNEISQTVQELSNARTERSLAEARLQEVTRLAPNAEYGEGAGAVVTSPLLESLRKIMADLRRSESDLSASFGRMHPERQAVIAQIASTEANIASEIQRIIFELRNEVAIRTAQIEGFDRELQAMDAELRSRAIAEIHLRELGSNLVFERRRYDKVVESIENLDRQTEVLTPSARLLSEAAVPIRPSFPNNPIILVGSALGSVLVAVILALLLDGFDTRIRSAAAVRQIVGVRNLAFVPRLRSKWLGAMPRAHRAIVDGLDRAYCEAVREVFLESARGGPGASVQSVMVTSSLQGEGSHDLAIGLAATAGVSGRRTILLGLDSQSDSLRTKLELPGDFRSLDAYLSGEAALADCILPCPDASKFDLALIRGAPQNSGLMLEARRIEVLLDSLRKQYDYIVVDGPPVLVSADFELIGGNVDAIVLAVRWGKTREETLRDVANHLYDRPVPLAGTAIIDVDMRSHAAGRYGGRAQYQRASSPRLVA